MCVCVYVCVCVCVCVCVLTSEGVGPERQQGQGQGQVPHTGVGLEQSHQRQQHIAQEHWVVTGGRGGGICILYSTYG